MHKTFQPELDHGFYNLTADDEARLAKLCRSFERNGVKVELMTDRFIGKKTTPVNLFFPSLPFGEFEPALVVPLEVSVRIAAERLSNRCGVILLGNGNVPLVLTSVAKWARQIRPRQLATEPQASGTGE
jgi:hypothetical protein